MTKARFDTKQPVLNVYDEGDKYRYMICQNETPYEDKNADADGNEQVTKGYEYDFYEFAEDKSVLDKKTVEDDPVAYISYVPVGGNKTAEKPAATPTLNQRVSDIEDAIASIVGGEI